MSVVVSARYTMLRAWLLRNGFGRLLSPLRERELQRQLHALNTDRAPGAINSDITPEIRQALQWVAARNPSSRAFARWLRRHEDLL